MSIEFIYPPPPLLVPKTENKAIVLNGKRIGELVENNEPHISKFHVCLNDIRETQYLPQGQADTVDEAMRRALRSAQAQLARMGDELAAIALEAGVDLKEEGAA